MTTTQTVSIATVGRSSMMHIVGLNATSNTATSGTEREGYVSAYAETACPTLTRSFTRTFVTTTEFVRNDSGRGGKYVSTVVEFTVADAVAYAAARGTLCAACARAAAAAV